MRYTQIFDHFTLEAGWGGGGLGLGLGLGGLVGGEDIFSHPNALQDIFFLIFSLSFLCRIFFSSKKCCLHLWKVFTLHCGYCSNSSNMKVQSFKML